MIKLALLLYVNAEISSRQVGKVIDIINLVFGNIVGKSPSHQTVFDWTCKYGLAIIQNESPEQLKDLEKVSLIIDNSVSVNNQEEHLQLLTDARHPGHALCQSDVRLARMTVRKGWNSSNIKDELAATIEELGERPEYVVCDNSSMLLKACRELGIPVHHDISHTFGMYLENVYGGTKELQLFNNAMGFARKFSHTGIGHLMPPQRRKFARFMNLFDRVDWAYTMALNYELLPCDARYYFRFVLEQGCFITELKEVMDCYRALEKLCKQEGLSHQSAAKCRALINKTLMQGDERLRTLGGMLLNYFKREESLLKSDDDVHNICSDIIESSFGYLKDRMSPNKFNGFTPLILIIPAHMKMADIKSLESLHVKEYLENTTLADVKEWRTQNLLPNPSVTRPREVQKVVGF